MNRYEFTISCNSSLALRSLIAVCSRVMPFFLQQALISCFFTDVFDSMSLEWEHCNQQHIEHTHFMCKHKERFILKALAEELCQGHLCCQPLPGSSLVCCSRITAFYNAFPLKVSVQSIHQLIAVHTPILVVQSKLSCNSNSNINGRDTSIHRHTKSTFLNSWPLLFNTLPRRSGSMCM